MAQRISLSKVTSHKDIDWTGFEPIGKGAYGVVFVRGVASPSTRYAIKVGNISEYDVKARELAAADGVSPKVYGYFKRLPRTAFPEHIASELIRRDLFDILIMERVIPAMDKLPIGSWTRTKEHELLSKTARASKLWYWDDDHNGNWGFTRDGRPVIFDGLYTR